MKKFLILLVMVMAFGFISCDNGTTIGSNGNPPIPAQFRGTFTAPLSGNLVTELVFSASTMTETLIDASGGRQFISRKEVFKYGNGIYCNSDEIWIGTFQNEDTFIRGRNTYTRVQ